MGCCSTRCRLLSMHAQSGALPAQIFTAGRTADGSSKVPARTTVNCGRTEVLANRCAPQRGQNRRRISLPLSAMLKYSLSGPELSSPEVGTRTFTVPLAAMC